jgi:hypothetical protein
LLSRAHGTAQQDSDKDGRREFHGLAPASGNVSSIRAARLEL